MAHTVNPKPTAASRVSLRKVTEIMFSLKYELACKDGTVEKHKSGGTTI
jgi:hypothetical protein